MSGSIPNDPERPRLAITLGDVCGIGPEIVVKAMGQPSLYERCRPLVIGDRDAVIRATGFVGRPDLEVNVIDHPREGVYRPGTIDLIQVGPPLPALPIGEVTPEAGAAAPAFVVAAAGLVDSGAADAIVTAPLHKEAMRRAGIEHPGHTELLAGYFGVDSYSLVLTAGSLFVFHVTTHVSLGQAIEQIEFETVRQTIALAHRFARAYEGEGGTVAVAGLNPHAGEAGAFGDEDESEIAPAVQWAAENLGPTLGPVPADALFPAAVAGQYRYVVMMYHDQGHVPFKSVFGDSGVNLTVGLPVLRTSVDHGTAFDIAGQGSAREESLIAACEMAARLAPRWGRVWSSMSLEQRAE